jgi:serine/threonine protein kinase
MLPKLHAGKDKKIHELLDVSFGVNYGNDNIPMYKAKFFKRNVAVKCVSILKRQFADNETRILMKVDQHPHIIRHQALFEDRKYVYIVEDFCERRLDASIDEFEFDKKHVLRRIHELVRAIKFIHAKGIIHLDIRPSNIFINEDGFIKLGGFWESREISDKSNTTRRDTDFFVAPELSSSKPRISKYCDLYSLGKVMEFVLAYRKDKDPLEIHQLGIEAQDLLTKLISRQPHDRGTIEDAVTHPLFWSKDAKLRFLCDVSDAVFYHKLEHIWLDKIENKSWSTVLSKKLRKELQKEGYDFSCTHSLLKLIRNMEHHYYEIPYIQKLIAPGTGIFVFFNRKYPTLFMSIYQGVRINWRNEMQFLPYFEYDNSKVGGLL